MEFMGPLILSVVTSRRALSLVWAALALGGVALLGREGFDGLDPLGAGLALSAGALWAASSLPLVRVRVSASRRRTAWPWRCRWRRC
ncbi:hypothetical protein SRIMM317S_06065 [Streptomyces rimosus subsp. rimosus]